MDSHSLNPLARIFWLIVSILFGAFLAIILFLWVACDMKMPFILIDFCAAYLPWCLPIFDVPYVQIDFLSSSIIGKLFFDALLYAIFGIAHTLFAQEWIQEKFSRILFPKPTLRTAYCIMVSATSYMIMGCWQHTNVQLWNWLPPTMNKRHQHSILLIVYNILFLPAWYVLIKFDLLEFSGIKQLVEAPSSSQCPLSIKSEQRTSGTQVLICGGLFRICRHPLYLSMLVSTVITPSMSLDRLAFLIYTSIYLYFAIPFEERKLIQKFGQAYVDYQQRVPQIIPSMPSFHEPETKSKAQ